MVFLIHITHVFHVLDVRSVNLNWFKLYVSPAMLKQWAISVNLYKAFLDIHPFVSNVLSISLHIILNWRGKINLLKLYRSMHCGVYGSVDLNIMSLNDPIRSLMRPPLHTTPSTNPNNTSGMAPLVNLSWDEHKIIFIWVRNGERFRSFATDAPLSSQPR